MQPMHNRRRSLSKRMTEGLFQRLQQPNATFARFAITFLDIWQAYIIFSQDNWLLPIDGKSVLYQYYAYTLALVGILAEICKIPRLIILVLAVNFIQFTYLAGVVLTLQPPNADAGLFIFVAIISLAAFMRTTLEYVKQREESVHA